ncbi:MAG: rhomboid family intramembrane serine protease [Ilumatobacteraceae bacterium]
MAFPPPVVEYCVRHPNVATGRHCTRCDRPACNDCLVAAAVGSQCLDCVRAGRLPRSQRMRHWNAAQPALVTRALVGINVAVFLWVMSGRQVLTFGGSINKHELDLALSEVFIANGEWWRLVTSGFLHFGLLHLGMNMLLLWQLGELLEPALDRARFALLYFSSMLGGAAGALLLSPDALTGGASGAVFGLMAAATVGLSQRGMNPFRTGIGATLLINLLITFTIPNISVGGHLGGAAMGAAVGYAMLEPRWKRPAPWIGWAAPVAGIVAALAMVASIT